LEAAPAPPAPPPVEQVEVEVEPEEDEVWWRLGSKGSATPSSLAKLVYKSNN